MNVQELDGLLIREDEAITNNKESENPIIQEFNVRGGVVGCGCGWDWVWLGCGLQWSYRPLWFIASIVVGLPEVI